MGGFNLGKKKDIINLLKKRKKIEEISKTLNVTNSYINRINRKEKEKIKYKIDKELEHYELTKKISNIKKTIFYTSDNSIYGEGLLVKETFEYVLKGCYFCGIKFPLEKHHIIPKKLNGSNNQENILFLCRNHHRLLHTRMNVKFNFNDKIVLYEEGTINIIKKGTTKHKLIESEFDNSKTLNMSFMEAIKQIETTGNIKIDPNISDGT